MPGTRILLAFATAVAMLGFGTAGAAASEPENIQPAGVGRQLAEVRLATAPFHAVEVAEWAGYRPAGPCAEAPDGSGAMGYHYANPELSADPGLDIHRPEALLYERWGGRLHLTGVEYIRTDADQDLATDDDRPSLFGLPFDGPMLGHEPGQPIHYDLHAWVWKHNRAGTFAQWNPTVSCP